MSLQIGDIIPEFLGNDENGNPVTAEQFKGKKLALYFYPKDNTPGCTAEACSLRDGYDRLRSEGYEVVGVSVDSESSHRKFIEKHSLPFTLIADTDKTLVGQFGVWQQKKMAGRTYMGTVRTTFLIDADGIIREKIEGKKVDTKNHAEQILAMFNSSGN